MPTHVSGDAMLISGVVWLLIIAMIVARNLRPRRLRVELLWVWPAILLLSIAAYFYKFPPKSLTDVAGLIVGFLIGAALGWWRGGFTRIEVDPATDTAMQQASPLGVLVILALFAVRSGVRYAVLQSGARAARLGGGGDRLAARARGGPHGPAAARDLAARAAADGAGEGAGGLAKACLERLNPP